MDFIHGKDLIVILKISFLIIKIITCQVIISCQMLRSLDKTTMLMWTTISHWKLLRNSSRLLVRKEKNLQFMQHHIVKANSSNSQTTTLQVVLETPNTASALIIAVNVYRALLREELVEGCQGWVGQEVEGSLTLSKMNQLVREQFTNKVSTPQQSMEQLALP